MNRLAKSVFVASMAATTIAGCSTPEKTTSPPTTIDAALNGRVDNAHMMDTLPPYTPQDCTGPERQTIITHMKSGQALTAEFYIPKGDLPAVAVREKDSNQHNGAGLKNPIVLRCGGKVVEFAAQYFIDGPVPEGFDPLTYDRNGLDVISADGAIFLDAREVGISPSHTSTRDPNALGRFTVLQVQPVHPNADHSIVDWFTDGHLKLGYTS